MNKMTQYKINNQEVIFKEQEMGKVVISSRDIAKVFEKEHKIVLRNIRELPQDDFNGNNFAPVKYTDVKGEKRPEYLITRDGFSMLVMGFTGDKAYKWKIEFIKAFNEMERMLNEKTDKAQLPQSYKEALAQLLSQVEANEMLQAKIEADKSKVAFAESVASSDDTISIGQLAKLLKQNGVETGRQRLFDFLRNKGYLIKGKSKDYNCPSQRAMEQGLFKIKETVVNMGSKSIISLSPRVTSKGQQYFIDLFLRHLTVTA